MIRWIHTYYPSQLKPMWHAVGKDDDYPTHKRDEYWTPLCMIGARAYQYPQPDISRNNHRYPYSRTIGVNWEGTIMTKQQCLEAEYRLTGRMPPGLRVHWNNEYFGTVTERRFGPNLDLVIRANTKTLRKHPGLWHEPHPNCFFHSEHELESLVPYDWWGKKK